jgi:hypothetical protein
MTKKALTYEQQHAIYSLMCEEALLTCSSGADYRKSIRDVQAQLSKDQDYALLVEKKFRAPVTQFGKSNCACIGQDSIADLVAEKA